MLGRKEKAKHYMKKGVGQRIPLKEQLAKGS
jgi:hypothetical protein